MVMPTIYTELRGRQSAINWHAQIRNDYRRSSWQRTLAASHRIPAVQALVASPAADGDRPANIARRRVGLEFRTLATQRIGDDRQAQIGNDARLRLPRGFVGADFVVGICERLGRVRVN